MDRIARAFEQKVGRAALIPFLNAGDPTLDGSLQLFDSVLSSGADIVEIGVPYSDPLADGQVIQQSALRSLEAGFRLPQAFELAARLRQGSDAALVLFSYVNPLLQYGLSRFFQDAAAAGVDGQIVPDLPYEESAAARAAADAAGVALIPLVAPTSGEARIADICAAARGFVYCVSALGVTGVRTQVSARVRELVAAARRHTRLPVAVGFGVSGPDQARDIAAYADGVVVGSAFVSRVQPMHTGTDAAAGHDAQVNAMAASVGQFTAVMAAALR